MAKDPKTIKEQIELLGNRNMAFRDVAKATHYLANISYCTIEMLIKCLIANSIPTY